MATLSPGLSTSSSLIVPRVGAEGDRTGASLRGTTSMFMSLGEGSRSLPPPAFPPSSRTWKRKLALAAPLVLAAGVKTRLPAAIDEALTVSPPLRIVVPSCRVPDEGAVVI